MSYKDMLGLDKVFIRPIVTKKYNATGAPPGALFNHV
jgi:hypothetical protein